MVTILLLYMLFCSNCINFANVYVVYNNFLFNEHLFFFAGLAFDLRASCLLGRLLLLEPLRQPLNTWNKVKNSMFCSF
jgi:hypothetical protein